MGETTRVRQGGRSGAQLHVGTHLDAPAHFYSGGKFVGDLPIDWLTGTACVVGLEKMGLGDCDLYGFERWEREAGNAIDPGEILIIHTGYPPLLPGELGGPHRDG